MRVVLQTRNTFQWQSVPVTASVWPPVTMCRMPAWFETSPMASAIAEFTLPSRKSTLSRSISLCAFCTAVPVSALVEILDQELDLAAENAALGVDLIDRQFAADLLVLAELGIGAGERIVEADLDRLVGAGLDHEWARDLHGADRQTGLEHRPALHRTV